MNTALSSLGYDATSFTHLDLLIFYHSYLEILSSSLRSNGDHCCHFQVSPEMFDRVQVRALAWLLNIIDRGVPKPLLFCLGCNPRSIGPVGMFVTFDAIRVTKNREEDPNADTEPELI